MIIEIDGVGRVEIDDSFADLSPDQQQAVVDRIRAEAAPKPAGEVPTQRLRAIAQGLTLGFGDEAEAAIRNPLSALAGAIGIGGQDYGAALQDIRGKLDAYRADPSVIMNLGTGNLGGAAQAAGRQALSRMQGMNERSAAAMSEMLFETDPVRQAQIMRRLVARGDLDAAMASRLLRRPEIYAGQLGATAGLLSGD